MIRLHQFWAQGADLLPRNLAVRRERWREALPAGVEMILWDAESVAEVWPEFRELAGKCYHYATMCDLVLPRLQYLYGGLAMGTDVSPLDADRLLRLCEVAGNFIVLNVRGRACSNAVSYFQKPGHPYLGIVSRHQRRDDDLHLGYANVWHATGPGCHWEVYSKYQFDVVGVPDEMAYRQLVEPGEEGSWQGAGGGQNALPWDRES